MPCPYKSIVLIALRRFAQVRDKPPHERYKPRRCKHKTYRQQRRKDYHFHFITSDHYTAPETRKKVLIIIAIAVH